MSQGLPHSLFVLPQADAMRRHLEKRPDILVTWDVVLVLRHDGKTCAPDVAVIEGGVDTSKITGAVNLAAVGGRLIFVLEAVSTAEKEIEDKDLEKNVVRYAQEGVEEYFTVYPVAERRVRDLVGRRRQRPLGGRGDLRSRAATSRLPPTPRGGCTRRSSTCSSRSTPRARSWW